MLVAAVAGILFVIAGIGVAGFAACLMITVEPEIAVMVECCGLPFCRIVAFCAGCRYLSVQSVIGLVSLVATDALFS